MRLRPLSGSERRPLSKRLTQFGILGMVGGLSGLVGSADWFGPGAAMILGGPVLLLVGVRLPPRRG